jgi:hypothetical protein
MSNELADADLDRRYGAPPRDMVLKLSELGRVNVRGSRSLPARGFGHTAGMSPNARFAMTRKPDLSMKPREVSRVTREDFELACIREFSHSGHHLGVGVSRVERRERIKAAILRENKGRQRWQGSNFSYAEIYAQAYQQTLALDDSDDKNALAAWTAQADDDCSDDEDALDDGVSPIA